MKTPATQFLDEHGVRYSEHFYDYVEHGGAERGAEKLGVALRHAQGAAGLHGALDRGAPDDLRQRRPPWVLTQNQNN